MKKVLAIVLLTVFLFNIIGYKIVFYYMEQQASAAMERQMDLTESAGMETITIKIPINLPYQTNWQHFERVDGEMTYKGTTYKYFKRKIYNDSLILVCVNFREKSLINKKSDDYFKKINDLAAETSKKQTLKQQKKDEYFERATLKWCSLIIVNKIQIPTGFKHAYPQGYAQIAEPPPQLLV